MLSDTDLRKIKPGDKPRKLFDAGGLYLYVTPAGRQIWRLKYRFDGKEKLLVVGHYPRMTLKRARDARYAAKGLLREGRDPAEAREDLRLQEVKRAASTFEVVAREWFNAKRRS